ncbi:MAG TPA: hypothetical protein VF263_04910, partial [Longimicrobiaceae bacterium]
MADDPFGGVPPLPPSVAEWEDLLVRLEIAPRALRAALEDAPADHPDVRHPFSLHLHQRRVHPV